ncbi:tRNA (guanine(26)-N(2))-dimethyltransferase [Artemisia annua]|uniref:tRNA (Guanine(26)-N(2))-dimethyltransferase n=1 Tax=Artemisia annua TaxID=35608 RepID=A0A2U1PAU0_ARTAN|nr:tRNA (guanine(26)-N(2))-dimethyltransferase [Artemisia annua]
MKKKQYITCGIQFATTQLPLLELMDYGMTICEPDASNGDSDSLVSANSKLHLIHLKLHLTDLLSYPFHDTLSRSVVINVGYRISGTHVNPLGLKFDAPMEVKNHLVKPQPPEDSQSVILAKEPVLQASFARAIAFSKAQVEKVDRFLPNPERHGAQNSRLGVLLLANTHLFWPEIVNEIPNNSEEQGDELEAKRKKIQDSTSIS